MLYPFPMRKQLLLVRNILLKLQTNKKDIRRESGFTLLEILIVLVCLSALLSIGLPGYRLMIQQHELRNSANQLVADLRECRSLAAAESQEYAVHLINDQGYSIHGNNLNKEVKLPSGITFQLVKMGLQTNAVIFNAKGHPLSGGSVVLQNRFGQTLTVTVYLHSGQIEIAEAKNE